MFPEVRIYADPFEGLTVQLQELRGLIKTVPPLIDADRARRWEDIGARPSDGEDGEQIDIYESESGAEEGWGFADFGRTIRVAAVVFAWAVFHDYLAHELKRTALRYDLSQHPALEKLVREDVRLWDRRFDQLIKRYRDFAQVTVSELPTWHEVLHAQELRNALVHNQGQYTAAYLSTKFAYRPTEEDGSGFLMHLKEAELINHEVIPLSLALTDKVIGDLLAAATEIRDAISRPEHRLVSE
jgi:hypothetical protein